MKNILIMAFSIIILFCSCKNDEYSYKTINPLCGPQCLLHICESYQVKASVEEVCALADYTEKGGTNMLGLMKAAEKKGFEVTGVKCGFEELCQQTDTSIAFVNGDHFIVVIKCMGDSVLVFDPPENIKKINKSDFKKMWRGETLLLSLKTNTQDTQNKIVKKGPKIKFEETMHYLGPVEQGTKIKHDFTYHNIGSDTLKIIALRTRCSCLDPLPDDRIIAPGGTGKISLEYNSTGKTRGIDKQSATVMCNDPEERVTLITLEALILDNIKVIPDVIDLGDLSFNQTLIKEILVKDSGNGKTKVDSTKAPLNFKAEIKPVIKDTLGRKSIPIELTVKTSDRLCIIEDSLLVFVSNGDKKQKISVPIRSEVVSDISAFPPEIVFGHVSIGKSVSTEIILSNKFNNPVSDLIIKAPQSIKVNTTKRDGKLILNILYEPTSKTKVLDENIKLYFKDHDNPVLEIPVFAKVIG